MLTSKYTLLVLINLPLIIIGVVSAMASYKTGRASRRRFHTEIVIWLLIGTALILAEPIYNSLIRHKLTASPPMSLFDVFLLTLLLFSLLLIKYTNEKTAELSKRLSRLHENLVIREELRGTTKK